MKKYGIYLFFSPKVSLISEGLGHYLANFLKSAKRKNCTFVIACPSWMKTNLMSFFEEFNIDSNAFEIISPKKQPCILLIYFKLTKVLKKIKFLFSKYSTFGKRQGSNSKIFFTKSVFYLLCSNNIFIFIIGFLGTLFFSPVILILFSVRLILFCIKYILSFVKKLKEILFFNKSIFFKILKRNEIINKIFKRIKPIFIYKINFLNPLFPLFYEIQGPDALDLNRIINKRKDITAWYCPTSFWPQFNKINTPKLICVPDVVVNHFPLSFAIYTNILNTFLQVEKTIKEGKYFVTYSKDVKYNTLVKNYNIEPSKVFVVHHGTNNLNNLINFDNEEFTTNYCESLISFYVAKKGIKFIFYASQSRPHKNILSLLRAYNYLLKRRYIGHKLILTGNVDIHPELRNFIFENNLKNDVLCLHGIPLKQLAACYKLADLAINPSLSEGGFPFTFAEALSVNTPVVMARIHVTEEIITDPELQKSMLFDPYDWKDMAEKIEWGLNNKEALLAIQKPFYNQLVQRTWDDVVNDYIKILDQISSKKE